MAAEHWEAVFVDTAVSPSSVLRVKIPGLDNGVSTREVTWSPIGNALPAAGDRVLVVEADDGAWWAVSWWSTKQTVTATRTVSGTVAANGAESSPEFSVVKNSTGDYTVTLTTAFGNAPNVVVGSGTTAGAISAKLKAGVAPTASAFSVYTFTPSTGSLADGEFTFVAHGAT